jgi:hypothetical protein
MIQKISFENYKAFEKGEIKLKPITILLGANSVGKSSIINLLLMLQQTANSGTYKSALRLNGENVSMGECENVFRHRNISRNISIELEFKSKELKGLFEKELFNDLISPYVGQAYMYEMLYRRLNKDDDRSLGCEITSHGNASRYLNKTDDSEQVNIAHFFTSNGQIKEKLYENKESFARMRSTLDQLYQDSEPNIGGLLNLYAKEIASYRISKETIDVLYDFLSTARELIKEDTFRFFVELRYDKLGEQGKTLKIQRVKIKQGDYVILEISLGDSKPQLVSIKTGLLHKGQLQEILDKHTQNELSKLISYESTIFSWFSPFENQGDFLPDFKRESYSIATKIISKIIDKSLSSARASFKRELVNHISPLRAHPRRFYFLDKANINTVLDTLDGNSLAEVLKENETVKKNVNSWLSKFGLQVGVSTIQDVIHQLKINQYALDLDITDVGFGISQILPIIVQGFLSSRGSLTMIEQPEIHLHPKMQANLADLFIDIARGNTVFPKRNKNKHANLQKHLLIETHSEYLLKRLMRRINEGVISSDQVAIYFVEPPKNEGDPSLIVEKEISQEGGFEWPKDFYEGEIKLDEHNFIKQLFVTRK